MRKTLCFAALISLSAVSLSLHANTVSVHKKTNNTTLPVSAKIDLNKAGVDRLTGSFKGIGKKRAESIVHYREQHHSIKSIEEFAEIKGLGPHFLEVNREKLKEVFVIK